MIDERAEDELHRVIRSKLLARSGAPSIFLIRSDHEFETKIDIISMTQVNSVFDGLSPLPFIGSEYRREQHTLKAWGADGYCTEIFVEGEPHPWYKIKTSSATTHSELLSIPIIRRKSKKLKPDEDGYFDVVAHQKGLRIIGRFFKHCYNFFFEFAGSVFSLSFSLASNDAGFTHNQMEIEFEGALSGGEWSEAQILSCFDALFSISLRGETANIVTKSDVLDCQTAGPGNLGGS
jgi:hypothetical protein